MGLLVFYIIFVVSVSFLCSLLEAVTLSINDTYIRQLQNQKRRSGDILKALKKDIDRPLAAILTLNTVANTLGAAGVGAQVLKLYGNEAVAIASGALTFVILIFSEIIPKTIGALHWKKIAPGASILILWLIRLLYPFVLMSEVIADLISKGRNEGPVFTREEIITSAEIGQEEGTIQHKEKMVIRNLLRLNNIFVKDVMTPRSVLVALPNTLTVDQAIEKYSPIPFSRIPVYGQDLDDIKGIVLRYELLETYGKDKGDTTELESILQNVSRISDETSVASALDQFIKRKEHLFVATDRHGKTTGLVTLEDTIETLLGVEIVDEFDSVEDMRQFALEQWKNRRHGRRTSRVVRSLISEMANEGKKNEE